MRNFFVLTALSTIATTAASGGLVSLSLQNGDGGAGPFNTTAFTLTNLSDAGVSLVTWSLTVGDTQYLYDFVYLDREQFVGGDATQTATLEIGDRTDDNVGPDLFRYGFTNFGAGIAFRGQWDIDNDNGDFNADARLVMFNNGGLPNAQAVFNFSDGSVAAFTFPDAAIQDVYTYTIPEPSTLVALALLAVALPRRR
ncbi:MAG: hypothetical protein ACKVS9_00680 [Phycisphaerae bacterium]